MEVGIKGLRAGLDLRAVLHGQRLQSVARKQLAGFGVQARTRPPKSSPTPGRMRQLARGARKALLKLEKDALDGSPFMRPRLS